MISSLTEIFDHQNPSNIMADLTQQLQNLTRSIFNGIILLYSVDKFYLILVSVILQKNSIWGKK